MPTKVDKDELLRIAARQWVLILEQLGGVPRDYLDGRHHACPKCGGQDRFRLIDQDAGALYCNQCCKEKNGDGLAALQWLNGWSFVETCEKLAEYLGVQFGKNGSLSRGSFSKKSDPAAHLEFIDWNADQVNLWCLKKEPIKPDALEYVGAKMAIYRKRHRVIAIPVMRESQTVGWVLLNITGGKLPVSRKFGSKWKTDYVKIKTTQGSKSGIIGRLDGEIVWKTEGPTDLLALISIGLPTNVSAFTNSGGAGEQIESKFDWLAPKLAGKQVRIVHDCDLPGQQGATWVPRRSGPDRPGWGPWLAATCEPSADVRNVVLPFDIAEDHGSDLRDWIVQGGDYQALEALAEKTEPVQPATISDDSPEESDDDPDRLARINIDDYWRDHRGKLVLWRDEWWKYKAGRYRKISEKELKAKVRSKTREVFEDDWRERQKLGGDEAAKPIRKVTQSLLANVIGAMESRLIVSESVPMPCWLPDRSRRNYVSMTNGILDLDALFAGEEDCLLDHSPNWFSPLRLDYAFDLNADCPRWRKYVEWICDGDDEKYRLLQEWAGYLLWPTSEQQKFLALEGGGGTGKTTFFAGIEAMVGSENVSNLSLEDFGERFSLASTIGKVANIAGDVGRIDGDEEAVLKRYTGGDRIEINRKFLPPISLRPTAKLMMAWNERPRFRDKSEGLWRRMILVQIDRTIAPEDRVFGMDSPLFWRDEAPGIMLWSLAGLARVVKKGGFTTCRAAEEAVREYRDEVNPVRQFAEDFLSESEGSSISSKRAYDLYRHWCQCEGYRSFGNAQFGKQLKQIFRSMGKQRKKIDGKLFWEYTNLKFSVSEISGEPVEERWFG